MHNLYIYVAKSWYTDISTYLNIPYMAYTDLSSLVIREIFVSQNKPTNFPSLA